jgi:chromosome segregation ATPase
MCGRHVPENVFDPKSLDADIYAVHVSGLGRGKGFAVSEPFSILGNLAITAPIADRCRSILKTIEGNWPATEGELLAIKAELESSDRRVLKDQRARADLLAELAELEGQSRLWRSEASKLQRMRDEDAAKLAAVEDELRGWERTAARLKTEVNRFELQSSNREYDEVEMLASEEMVEILDMINSSANTDFEYLIDAVEFLLEGG